MKQLNKPINKIFHCVSIAKLRVASCLATVLTDALSTLCCDSRFYKQSISSNISFRLYIYTPELIFLIMWLIICLYVHYCIV